MADVLQREDGGFRNTKNKTTMSKYVHRILDEVWENFERHFEDKEEREEFLEELINELENLKDRLERDCYDK
jgi:hypothetical protein